MFEAQRHFEEVWNQGRIERVEDWRASDAVATGLGDRTAESHGNSPFRTLYFNLRRAFPDLYVSIDDLIAEGEKVAVRCPFEGTHLGDTLGTPSSSRKVRFSSITIVRVVGGRIVQAWNNVDQLGLLMQIGAIPPAEAGDRFLTERP